MGFRRSKMVYISDHEKDIWSNQSSKIQLKDDSQVERVLELRVLNGIFDSELNIWQKLAKTVQNMVEQVLDGV